MRQNNILIAGDLFPTPVNTGLFVSGDVDTLFGEKLLSMFREATYSICNLEGVLTTSVRKKEKVSGPCMKAAPNTIKAIKDLGVKCLATANNHVMDYYEDGYRETRQILEENHIDFVGSGWNIADLKKYVSVTIGSHNICVYNVAERMYNQPTANSPGVNLYDEYQVCKEINMLKKKHDYLIVIYHGGVEFLAYPTPMIRQRFHRMADSGADLITSQHTHCLGCEERYGNAYLFYGGAIFCLIDTKGIIAADYFLK